MPVLRALGLAVVFATFAWVNVRGVAMGTRLIEAITVTKLLPLLLLTAVGLLWVKPEHLALEWAAPDRIGTASITLIFAFVGIEIALVPSGEMREPARTVPRAVFLALGLTTLLYLLLQLVAHAVLGPALASFADAPLAEVASRTLGPLGKTLVLVGGGISMLGFLSGDALGSPRSLYAFARPSENSCSAGVAALSLSGASRPANLRTRTCSCLGKQMTREPDGYWFKSSKFAIEPGEDDEINPRILRQTAGRLVESTPRAIGLCASRTSSTRTGADVSCAAVSHSCCGSAAETSRTMTLRSLAMAFPRRKT